MMLKTSWKDLPWEYHCLRGFFTEHIWGLFRNTVLTGNLATYVFFLYTIFIYLFHIYIKTGKKYPVMKCNYSDRRAAEILAHEMSYPCTYSEELHESSQVFLDLGLPSKTLKTPSSLDMRRQPSISKLRARVF
jgi:hypothetical protein